MILYLNNNFLHYTKLATRLSQKMCYYFKKFALRKSSVIFWMLLTLLAPLEQKAQLDEAFKQVMQFHDDGLGALLKSIQVELAPKWFDSRMLTAGACTEAW